MDSPRKVFLSYRSVDQARVRATAEALRAAGIDAWLDEWEILPGDNLVTKINQGLETCNAGVVFLSKASLDGKWHQDEITMLKVLAVDEGRPVIPVLLDPDAKVPVILRPYSRLTADQIPQLIDAIMGRTGKPGLGEPRQELPCRRLVIRLRELPGDAIGVSAEMNGKAVGEETSVRPGPDFEFSYADFVHGRLPGSRFGSPADEAVAREHELRKLGEAVGRVVFAGEIGREVAQALDEAGRGASQVELIFESGAARLLSVPFESAALPDGRAPALLPAVFVWRRLAGKPRVSAHPLPGPLRVLVAVGAPDEGKTAAAVLDSERELQTIFDALEGARRLGNAYVRVLEVGSPDQIGAALSEGSYHVLHLSGHGNRGVLELEDEDGNPVKATAADLARKIQESGHPAPLVFLASCHGGLGNAESASLAQGLLAGGVPAALAMQTAVSDWYATELAGRFYEELARAERPLPSRALALARRALEEQRKQNLARGQWGMETLAEYATPALFLAGEENAVLDRGLALEPVREPPAPRSVGKVPLLKLGDLIGRRRDLREIVRVLTDDERSVAERGRKAGCQILGTGGVGKSTVAGRVMQRMVDRGWRVATVSGAWNLGDVASAVGAALWEDANPNLAKAAGLLANPQAPDNVRLQWLQAILAQHELLLVLDNFEDVLTLGGDAFRDQTVRAVFEELLGAAQRAKLLVTSRYPLPGAEASLQPVELGPLSRAETRKLMLRHEGLKGIPPESARLIERAIGGHPRTLEYLDALLRLGKARLDRVQVRLSQYAKEAGVRLDQPGSLEERLRDAVRVAAADALVDELLQLIGENPAGLELLWQASVYPMPVPPEALAFHVASDVEAAFRPASSAPLPSSSAPDTPDNPPDSGAAGRDREPIGRHFAACANRWPCLRPPLDRGVAEATDGGSGVPKVLLAWGRVP
ncbi:MAG TPA: TIR domain-containing protein [Terriglobia bacterium]|nr:TIR domain-containing protein [Terriglobia bacterium]